MVISDDSDEEQDLYNPKKATQRDYRKGPKIMTRSNCIDADRMGISIRQQQVVIKNTLQAVNAPNPRISTSGIYKARLRNR